MICCGLKIGGPTKPFSGTGRGVNVAVVVTVGVRENVGVRVRVGDGVKVGVVPSTITTDTAGSLQVPEEFCARHSNSVRPGMLGSQLKFAVNNFWLCSGEAYVFVTEPFTLKTTKAIPPGSAPWQTTG